MYGSSDCLWFTIALLCNAGFVNGLIVTAEGGVATERTTDIVLSCEVQGIISEEELLRATWYYYDQTYGALFEIFSADLTNDQPAFFFSSKWAGRGQHEPMTMATIRLPARYVTRDFGGSYRCQVNSLLLHSFADTRVDIWFGPGTSIVIAPGGRIETQEGEKIEFACSAQCSPACSYRWYKAGRKVSSSPVLTLPSLSRDNGGLYACQARNQVGRSIKPVDLRVRFAAAVTALDVSGMETEPTTHQNLNAFELPHSISEGSETIALTCQVTAWPAVTIDWLHNESKTALLSDQNRTAITTTQIDLEHKSSRFEIKSATCLDNGNYTCKAWNGVGIPSKKTFHLNISCSPFETHHLESCQSGKAVNIIKSLNEHFHLTICFFGNPEPSVTMGRLAENNDIVQSYEPVITCSMKFKQCEASFKSNITSPEQYGTYVVKISNTYGVYEKHFHVKSQQSPLPPVHFVVTNISFSSACFIWRASFNGGAKQRFKLIVQPSTNILRHSEENSWLKEFSIDEDESTRMDAYNSTMYSVCAEDLEPSSAYVASITTANVYGTAAASENITFHTLGSPTTSIPSWLTVLSTVFSVTPSVIKYTSSVPNALNTSQNFNHQDGQFFTRTTEEREEMNDKSRNSSLFVDEDDEEDDKKDAKSEHDGVDDDHFFDLFDVYFTPNHRAEASPSAPIHLPIKKHPLLNYSSHLKMLYLKYAHVQKKQFGLQPLDQVVIETTILPAMRNSTLPLWTSASPSKIKSTSSSTLIQSLTIAAICIGVLLFLGAVASLCCILYYKKRQCQEYFRKDYEQRLKANNSAKFQQNFQRPRLSVTSTGRLSQRQNADREFRNGISSIRSVCNENVMFFPSAPTRPRLSTPDLRSTRPKLRTSTSVPTDESDSTASSRSSFRSDIPVITLENQRMSCPSYLDLVAEGDVVSKSTPDDKLRDNQTRSNNGLFLQPPSRVSSYISINQVHVRPDRDEDQDDNRSYLDLYETLASRAASRSPSNVYDPIQFENTNQNGSSGHSSSQHRTVKEIQTEAGQHYSYSIRNNDARNSLRKSNASGPECINVRSKTAIRPSNNNSIHCRQSPAEEDTSADSFYETVDGEPPKNANFAPVGDTKNATNQANRSRFNVDDATNKKYPPAEYKANHPAPALDYDDMSDAYMIPCVNPSQTAVLVKPSTRNETDYFYNTSIPFEAGSRDTVPSPLTITESTRESYYVEIDDIMLNDKVEINKTKDGNEIAPLPPHHTSIGSGKPPSYLVNKNSLSLDSHTPHSDIKEVYGYVQEEIVASMKRDSVASSSKSSSVYNNDVARRESKTASLASDVPEFPNKPHRPEENNELPYSNLTTFGRGMDGIREKMPTVMKSYLQNRSVANCSS